jgi:HTH-type transcriptional regulator/antitoxin HigA
MQNKQYKPYLAPIAIHPGETLLDEIEYLNIKQVELAHRTGISEKHINEIIKGKASITPDTAIKIEKAIGLNAKGMLGLQVAYNETVIRLNQEKNK